MISPWRFAAASYTMTVYLVGVMLDLIETTRQVYRRDEDV